MNECHNMPVNAVQGFLFIEHNGSNRSQPEQQTSPEKSIKAVLKPLVAVQVGSPVMYLFAEVATKRYLAKASCFCLARATTTTTRRYDDDTVFAIGTVSLSTTQPTVAT